MLARVGLALLLIASARLAARGQCQQAKLIPPSVQQGDRVGSAVAVEGTTAVVGAAQDDQGGVSKGAAHVYEFDGSSWQLVQELVGTNVPHGALFGSSIAFSGDWIAVGAHGDAVQGWLGVGSVWLYQRQGGTWVHTQRVHAIEFKPNARFGSSVALAGDHLVVGARQDFSNGLDAGAAFVFERQGSTWVQAERLLPSTPQIGASFGWSVAAHGQFALVGAPGQDGPGTDTGVAFLFERTPSGWVERQVLAPSSFGNQLAGTVVSIQDQVAFIGAPAYCFNCSIPYKGACYVFREQSGIWTQTQRLLAADPKNSLLFGSAVAAFGKQVLISAFDDDLGDTSGSVYHFEDLGSSYVQVGKLLASDGMPHDFFGKGVALWGDTALVGAERTDEACPTNVACDSGSAYVFRISSDVVQFCSCPSAAPCGNPDDFGGCANSTGQGAVLSACGSTSVVLDELALQGRWLPPNAFALLFTGGTFTNTPFGDGSLCVLSGATGIHRFALAIADPGGTVHYGPGLAALSQAFPPAGQIQPGDVRYFQMWYRDPAGPCGSATNLTNALRVRFQP